MYVAKMYVAFVDFRKAFDSVRRCELLDTFTKGRNISQICRDHKGHVHFFVILFSTVKNRYTNFFQCASGVRQGCVLSPTLFFCLFVTQLAEHM